VTWSGRWLGWPSLVGGSGGLAYSVRALFCWVFQNSYCFMGGGSVGGSVLSLFYGGWLKTVIDITTLVQTRKCNRRLMTMKNK